MLWHLPPSRSTLPTTTLPTYSLPAASSSLTTIHNNNSSSILTLGLILTQSQFLFCFIRLSSLRSSRTYYHLSTPSYTSSYNGSYYSPDSQHSAIFFRRRYPAAGFSKSHERVRTLGLRFTNDSDYMSPHFSLPTTTDILFSPSILVVQDEKNNTHLNDLRRSRPSSLVLNHPSPAIPSSPQPAFDPSPRISLNFGTWLSIRQTRIPHLFSRSQRPKSFACQ